MDKKKILVADDEAQFLEVMKNKLEENDYDVITASDGKEALAKIKSEKPDAVLLDILMPGMDGIAVLKKIRKVDSELPVFILTVLSKTEAFKLANELHASGFIFKTNDLQEGIRNITSALWIADRFKGKT